MDSTHTVAEVVETNNRRDSRGENSVVVTATAKPDLVTTISQYDHADRWNDSAKVILYVNNPGSLAVGPNRTRLFLSRDAKLSADDVPLKVLVGSTSMKYFYISHMKAGGTVAEEVTVKLPAKPAGWQGLDYYVIAMADSPKTVAELNEANNVSSGKMNIQPWRPDLTPGLMGVPATGHWGGTVALQFSAMNVGGGACRSFNVRFSLTDPSGAKTAPLNLVGGKTTCWYPALAYQANSPTKTVTIRLPAVRPAGLAGRRFRILIQLDPSNRINEVDETNNSAWTDLITVT
jgi:subtilase family serine protease